MSDSFKVCSSCRKPIDYGSTYYLCSVSTCQRKRVGLFFCSVSCWEAHLPEMRHREAWAEENTAPTREQHEQALAAERRKEAEKADAAAAKAANRKRVVAQVAGSSSTGSEVLVVVSKLKQFIRDQSGMNTSEDVAATLSNHLRAICIEAIKEAALDDRKTVKGRDFKNLKS